MGRDDDRPAAPCRRDPLAQPPLGHQVERGGGLVQQQHRRRRQHGTRDREPLTLTLRPAQPTLDDRGLQAARQPANVLLERSRPQGAPQLVLARATWSLPVLHRGLLYIAQHEPDMEGNPPRLICYDLRR